MSNYRDIEAKISYIPYPWQLEAHRSKARFKVLALGRRSGKDRFMIMEAIYQVGRMCNEQRPGLIPKVHAWLVAPTFPLASQMWRELKYFTPKALLDKKPNDSSMSIDWNAGARFEIRSADNPDNLVSVGLDFLGITEAGKIKAEAWTQSLQPCLASPGRAGRVVMNGTPKGCNWFHACYKKGQDPNDEEWASWNLPSTCNPDLTKKEFDRLKREQPDLYFRQEIMAEFISGGGVVFRNVDACALPDGLSPKPNGEVVIGVDLGKHQDFTVITGMDTSHQVVYWERFNKIDWVWQQERILEACRAFDNCACVIDATGLGDPVYDALQSNGLDVTPYKFTGPSKDSLIRGLGLAMDRREISYPQNPILMGELTDFTFDRTPQGNFTYSAPEGQFDDCVISLALANWGVTNCTKAEVIYA